MAKIENYIYGHLQKRVMANEEFSDEFESVYSGDGREGLVEDDEISPEEEAFMAGYDSEDEKKKEDEDDDDYEKAFDEAESSSRSKKKVTKKK